MVARRLSAALLAAAAAVAALAGCGGTSGRNATPATSKAQTFALPPAPRGRHLSGKQVFATDCIYCHSLTGHSKPSQQGGDLLNYHASRAQMLQLTAEMPVVHRPLTRAEVAAVVDYVMEVESRR